MGSEIETVEERLKSFIGQLQAEYGVFDRIVYKNKNQHRRSSYFQFLLKVRRDLRLLQSAKLEEILNSSFHVISGNKPKQKVQLLESLKRRRCDGGKYNFLERLLGVARLLSQMVEPMLKAATEISTLLARSFFMGFSMTVLALLARLRVLVQQILLDVVSVFNVVSSLSQTEQAVKITQEGFEVFREYYPTKEQEAVSLECVWETDKFVLVEKINKSENKSQEKDTREDISVGASTIQYQSIEVFLGDDGCCKTNSSCVSEQCPVNIKQDNTSSLVGSVVESSIGTTQLEDGSGVAGHPGENLPPDGLLPSISSSGHSNPVKHRSGSRNKVAFVSVKRPAPSSTAKELEFGIKGTGNNDGDKEDPFFSLLTGGNLKNSLF